MSSISSPSLTLGLLSHLHSPTLQVREGEREEDREKSGEEEEERKGEGEKEREENELVWMETY